MPQTLQARLQSEREAAEVLLPRCSRCTSSSIPFDKTFIEMDKAANSSWSVARLLASQYPEINAAHSVANWLRQVAHELEAYVASEQIRRTRLAADAQQRAMKARKVRQYEEQTEAQKAAQAAFEALVEMEI